MSERPQQVLSAALLLAAIAALLLFAVARAETVAGDNVRVSFHGWITPKVLPRSSPAPVALHVDGRIRPRRGKRPVALSRFSVEVNRHALFTTHGLPSCPLRRIRGTGSRAALAVCSRSLLGTGRFNSHIDIPEQAPFPAVGRVLAFKTTKHGRPAIAIHVFGRNPAPTSTVLAASYSRGGRGTGSFGPKLSVEMPKIGDEWGYVTGFALTLERRYRFGGRVRSVVRASCPAPADLHTVPFKAARGSFELANGRVLTRTVLGTCTPAG